MEKDIDDSFAAAVYEQFDKQNNICFESQDDTTHVNITNAFGNFTQLIWIERFVQKVASTRSLPFIEDRRVQGGFMQEMSIAKDFKLRMKRYLGLYSRRYVFSPHVTLFFDCCKELNLLTDFNDHFDTDLFFLDCRKFNDLVELIRKEIASSKFKVILKRRIDRCKAMFEDLDIYVNCLFSICSRMLVLRVDLHYCQQYCGGVTLEEAKADLQHLWNNKRNKPALFSDMKGYIWRLEQGEEKGFHFHVIFFFDSAKVNDAVWRAKCIGEYWRDIITKGRGSYFNCNAKEHAYKYPGIGRVSHFDTQIRWNLREKVLRYLAKADQFLMVKNNSRDRLFGRGEMPEVKVGGAGRPRIERSLNIC